MSNTTRRLTAGIALLLIGLSLILSVNLTAPRTARANPGVLYAAPTAISAVARYTFDQFGGTYTPITGGTVHGTGTIDDVNYNAVNIGFTFNYDGVAYTQVSLNTNGFLRFGGTSFSGSCSYTPISSSDTTCSNLVSALAMDLQGNTGGELRSETIGTAPNRVFVVQWKDFRYYGASGESFNFQIRLYETTDVVEIVYGSFTKNATSRSPQVGLKGATNADYNNRTGTDWAASIRGGSNSATMTLAQTSLPASGQTYQWTPFFGVFLLYAAPTAQGSGDCSSWANACTLQTALAQAFRGDEIWVKAGVHYPGAAGNRTATFTLKNGVALYGGFAGTETSRDQRDWQTNVTILSGDIDRNDINTDGNFIAETWNDIQGSNAYHVVTGSGTDATAVLDGFVITAGQANGTSWPHYYGGGMYNPQNSNPTLTNLTFSGNQASSSGGGMYNEGSPTLTNASFSGNYATSFGGGVFNGSGSSLTLTNVTFSNNLAGNAGGGMDNFCGDSMLTNVIFANNSAARGGGMYNSGIYGGGYIRLANVVFSGNSADSGGGMYNRFSGPTLTNVIFSNNVANYGGGMHSDSGSNPILVNVTFSTNLANYGGGISNQDRYADPTLTNVIVWGNTAIVSGDSIYNDAYNTPTISYSNIQGCGGSGNWNSTCGTDGGNNMDADPLFVDAAGGNLRLQPSSPCIDAGNDAAVPPGITTDLDGNPRFNYTVDMGAYEYQHTAPGPRPFGKALPLNGDTSQPLSVILSWRASALVNRYEYCYDTINNDACDTTWLTTTETLVNISGLNAGTSYYWQVRAVNNEGTTYADGGIWWSFTTAPSAPGFFNKASPARGATYQPFSPTLSWNASPGVEQYEYCYDATDDNTCSPWLSVGTATSVTLTNLLPGTTYYWQVRAVNAYGVTYADRSNTNFWAFTTYPRPGDFNKVSPASGSDRLRTVTLSWSASRDVEAYEYCYDTTNDNDCSTWLSVGINTSVALSDLLPNTTYYWQVRARNVAGITYANGSSNNFWSFTTALSPGAFSKVSPANNAETEAGVTLSWGASTDAAIYEYCYDTTDDGICSQWQSAGTSTSVALNLGPGTYYWQVRARNVAGITYANGSSTDFWSFRVNIARWSGGKISFLTDIERTQWMSFTLRFGGTFPCIVQYGPPIVVINVSFEETVIAAGPGVISNDQFGFSSPTFSFTGQFNSAITATGVYSLTNYQVVRVVYYYGPHTCILPVTLSEAWSASRPLLRPGVFGKAEPANGATNQNTTLALGWDPSIEAAEYQYCLDTTANNACDTNWISAGTNLGVDLSGLAEGTTYYWQVRASNTVGATEADDGAWWSFTTRDTIAPTVVSITRADASPTNAATVRFLVAFSEAVQNVDAGDFSLTATGLTGASVTGVSGSGAVYTVTVSTGAGSGTLRLDIPTTATISDLSGNALSGLPYTSGESYTVDKTAPTVVSITRADASPTNAATVRFVVTFSEAVQGVDAGDFSVTAAGLTGGSVTDVSGSGTVYTITVSTGDGSGTLRLDIPESATISDLVGNALSGLPYTDGESYTVDRTAPTVVSVTRLDPSPTSAASVRFWVAFSEAVQNVDASDFSLTVTGLTGASVTGVTGSGAVYTVTVSTGAGSGTLRLDIPTTATIGDLVGNPLSGLPYTNGEVYEVSEARKIFLPLVVRN